MALDRRFDRTRRTVLRAGALGALGMPSARRGNGADGPGELESAPRAKSVIVIYAGGGISHHESFDPKPDAPAEVRGEFGTIATAFPGVRFGELLPKLATRTGRYALIRSLKHTQTDHGVAAYYVLRGFVQPDPTFDRPENQYRAHPNIGSHVARLLGSPNGLPPYVCVPGTSYLATVNYYTSGWMGRPYDPYLLKSDPSDEKFQLTRLPLELEVAPERLHERMTLSRALDALDVPGRRLDDSPAIRGKDDQYAMAYRALQSESARQAFDLHRESATAREAYGATRMGQSCVLARRLVEAGVPFVTVDDFDWDHHGTIFPSLRKQLPELDTALAALLDDLHERGLLETTLVALLTDFGRTPVINSNAGRDHWPAVGSVLLAGAGIRGGQVVGASDKTGGAVRDRPVGSKDLAATMYRLLGIDPFQEYQATDGRPLQVLDQGEALRELM
jgi:uncharacterized protein (DUF1501 family)